MPIEGEILWTPPPDRIATHAITAYRRWLNATRGLALEDYPALWRWSTDHLEDFWASIWEKNGLGLPLQKVKFDWHHP